MDGGVNLAPYSFFNAVSEDPAIVMFSVQASGPEYQKDTLRNVNETGAFTVNIVGANQVQAMNISSGDYPYGENEFNAAKLSMIPGTTVNVPHVGDVPRRSSASFYRPLPFQPMTAVDITRRFWEPSPAFSLMTLSLLTAK